VAVGILCHQELRSRDEGCEGDAVPSDVPEEEDVPEAIEYEEDA
jgi:hypothetical protein